MRKHAKQFPMLACLLWAILSSATVADTIAFIDINSVHGSPGTDSNGNVWNATDELFDTVLLVDTFGNATGWTLTTEETGDGTGTGLTGGGYENEFVPPAPYNIATAYQDGWFDDDRAPSGPGMGDGQFTISGLDDSLDYELHLFNGRSNGSGRSGNIDVVAGTAVGGPTFVLLQNELLTILAQPSGGTIRFTLDQVPDNAGNTSAMLNLFSIREISAVAGVPEPTSIALWLMGALGCGLVLFRRRAPH